MRTGEQVQETHGGALQTSLQSKLTRGEVQVEGGGRRGTQVRDIKHGNTGEQEVKNHKTHED